MIPAESDPGDEQPERQCGLVLNPLHAPCHLPRLHEGFHQSQAAAGVVAEWWTPGAPARERRYLTTHSKDGAA